MSIEEISRLVIHNDTQANVEAADGVLAEIRFGRDTATGAIGYTVDAGATWVWLPAAAGAAALDDLTDVVITSPVTNQLLKYDGSHWINYTPAAPAGSKYRQFLYTVVSGNPTFLTDNDGNILTVALDAE